MLYPVELQVRCLVFVGPIPGELRRAELRIDVRPRHVIDRPPHSNVTKKLRPYQGFRQDRRCVSARGFFLPFKPDSQSIVGATQGQGSHYAERLELPMARTSN